MSHRPTYYARNLDKALWDASCELEREPRDLEYRWDELETGGIKVVILNAPERDGDAPPPPEGLGRPAVAEVKAPEPVRSEAGEVPPLPTDLEPPAMGEAVLAEILGQLGLNLEHKLEERDGNAVIEIKGEDQVVLLANEGRLLDSLQYLVSRIVQHHHRGAPSVVLDVDGRRERRVIDLAAMSERVADTVVQLGAGIGIDAATAAERKAIHQALSGRRDVVTESDGFGTFRRLTVRPKGALSAENGQA